MPHWLATAIPTLRQQAARSDSSRWQNAVTPVIPAPQELWRVDAIRINCCCLLGARDEEAAQRKQWRHNNLNLIQAWMSFLEVDNASLRGSRWCWAR